MTTRSPRLLRAAAFIAALAFALPSLGMTTARHINTPGVLYFEMDGPAWYATTFVTDGGGIRALVGTYGASSPGTQGILIYGPDERVFDRFIEHTRRGAHGVAIDASPTEGMRIRYDSLARPGSDCECTGVGIGAGAFEMPPGTYTAILWGGGPVASTEFMIEYDPGVVFVADTRGSSVFVHDSTDFRGPLAAQAWAGDLGARGAMGADLAIDVENLLVGSFSLGRGSTGVLSVTTPRGEIDCPCDFTALTGPTVAGPGRYVFHVTGAGVGSSAMAEALVGGADIRLPE